MPRFDEHCAESLKTFGRDFAEVHLWLDAFTGKRDRQKTPPFHGMREAMNGWGCLALQSINLKTAVYIHEEHEVSRRFSRLQETSDSPKRWTLS